MLLNVKLTCSYFLLYYVFRFIREWYAWSWRTSLWYYDHEERIESTSGEETNVIHQAENSSRTGRANSDPTRCRGGHVCTTSGGNQSYQSQTSGHETPQWIQVNTGGNQGVFLIV